MLNSYRGLPFCLSAVLTAFYPESVSNVDLLRMAMVTAQEQGYGAIEFFYEGSKKGLIAIDLPSSGLRSIFLPSFHLKREQLDLGSPDKAIRNKALQDMKRYIDDARYYGSERVMVVSGANPESNDITGTLDILAQSLDELCEYAAESSEPLKVSIESFNNMGEPYYLLGPTDRSVEFAHRIRRKYDNYGITIDLSHMMQMDEDPMSSLQIADRVCDHIHIANSVTSDKCHALYGDKHLHLDDFEGDVTPTLLKDFVKNVLHLRREKTYVSDLFLGLEVINRGAEKQKETMLSTKAFMDRIFTEIEAW